MGLNKFQTKSERSDLLFSEMAKSRMVNEASKLEGKNNTFVENVNIK